MTDKAKTGELENGIWCDLHLDVTASEKAKKIVTRVSEFLKDHQSPPVQSDEVIGAVERCQKLITSFDLFDEYHDAIKTLIRAAEQRVAGQVEVLISALEEIREIYVGSEGFIAETAPEAYLQQEFRKQYDVAVKALAISGKEE